MNFDWYLLDTHLYSPNETCQPPPLSQPSLGGNLYSDDLCRQVLQKYFNDNELRDVPEMIPLRAANIIPYFFTCVSWIYLFHATGDVCPKHVTGHHHADRDIRSIKQDHSYGASNIVLPYPGSYVIFHLLEDLIIEIVDMFTFQCILISPSSYPNKP
jgi:hypothetical protein